MAMIITAVEDQALEHAAGARSGRRTRRRARSAARRGRRRRDGRREVPGGVHRDRPLGAAAGAVPLAHPAAGVHAERRRSRSQLALCWGVETFLVPEVKHTDDMVLQLDSALLRHRPVRGRRQRRDRRGRAPRHPRLDQRAARAPRWATPSAAPPRLRAVTALPHPPILRNTCVGTRGGARPAQDPRAVSAQVGRASRAAGRGGPPG